MYTFGTRSYATKIAQIIDPTQKIFKERILSRNECDITDGKTLKRIFPCDDSMVVIVDDREDVWSFSPNLIKIDPFIYFKGAPDINPSSAPQPNIPTPTPAEPDKNPSQSTPSPPDDCLPLILSALQRVHAQFYSEISRKPKVDVKEIISRLKKNVLSGLHVVFSGFYPIAVDIRTTPFGRLTEDFGAVCSADIYPSTTHLIAKRRDTSKVNVARANPNILVVNENWLLTSIRRWQRADERDFPLKKEGHSSQHNNHEDNNKPDEDKKRRKEEENTEYTVEEPPVKRLRAEEGEVEAEPAALLDEDEQKTDSDKEDAENKTSNSEDGNEELKVNGSETGEEEEGEEDNELLASLLEEEMDKLDPSQSQTDVTK